MEIIDEARFWCPECKMIFSNSEKGKVAVCPRCKYERKDGLNLLEDGRFQCTKCGSKFPNLLKTEGPKCINGCKF